MSLKKPIGIPKIPKTRKKKAHFALTAIPLKKPDKIEFICKTFFQYDNKLKKQFYAFVIETIVEFAIFAYEISVEVIRQKNELNFIITGLRAKMNAIPIIQSAKKEILFEDLIGDYTVNVLKQDGAINSAIFNFNIYSKEILLKQVYKPKKKNNRHFCEFEVAKENFTFPD